MSTESNIHEIIQEKTIEKLLERIERNTVKNSDNQCKKWNHNEIRQHFTFESGQEETFFKVPLFRRNLLRCC